MNSRACLVLLAGALLGACEPASAPQPSILAVEPAEVVATGQSAELRLHIDALLPGTMDYGRRSVSGDALDSVVQVWIGERQVGVERYEAGGILVVSVPADVAVGTHDVRLVLSDGRAALRLQGLVVRRMSEFNGAPGALADGGSPTPDAGLVEQVDPGDGGASEERAGLRGFLIDSVGEQVRYEPFTLVLRAQGSLATSFQGMVTLSVSSGSIQPTVAGPFVDGLVQVQVTLSQPGAKLVITAVDEHGNQGSTNEFRVWPH